MKDGNALTGRMGKPGAILKGFIELMKPVFVDRAQSLVKDAALSADVAGLGEALSAVAEAVGGSPSVGALTEAGARIKKVAAALVPQLESAASKAFSYTPLQELVSRGIDLIATQVGNPQALVSALQGGESFTKTLLGKLDDVLGPFAESSVKLLVPKGLGRNLALAAVDIARKTLRDPSKVKAFVDKAKSGFGGVVKSILLGNDGLLEMLLGEVKSDALRAMLKGGVELVTSQIAK